MNLLQRLLTATLALGAALPPEALGQPGGSVGQESCVVPPYVSLYPPDVAPERLEDTLMLEGRCYLACLEEESDITVNHDA